MKIVCFYFGLKRKINFRLSRMKKKKLLHDVIRIPTPFHQYARRRSKGFLLSVIVYLRRAHGYLQS